jgi:photoactive yellow protein
MRLRPVTTPMETLTRPTFDSADLPDWIATCGEPELDEIDFGVIGFDVDGRVRRYNTTESRLAGLAPERVLGQLLFTSVAPCMNNFMVCQRFEDALRDGAPLDETIDYVLTLRMRPIKVKLRLLARPGDALRHVLVQRRA